MRAIILLACLLSGCAVPTAIPTGNPLTDMLVNVALEETARVIVTNQAGSLLARLSPEPQCQRGRSGVLYCGDWQ